MSDKNQSPNTQQEKPEAIMAELEAQLGAARMAGENEREKEIHAKIEEEIQKKQEAERIRAEKERILAEQAQQEKKPADPAVEPNTTEGEKNTPKKEDPSLLDHLQKTGEEVHGKKFSISDFVKDDSVKSKNSFAKFLLAEMVAIPFEWKAGGLSGNADRAISKAEKSLRGAKEAELEAGAKLHNEQENYDQAIHTLRTGVVVDAKSGQTRAITPEDIEKISQYATETIDVIHGLNKEYNQTIINRLQEEAKMDLAREQRELADAQWQKVQVMKKGIAGADETVLDGSDPVKDLDKKFERNMLETAYTEGGLAEIHDAQEKIIEKYREERKALIESVREQAKENFDEVHEGAKQDVKEKIAAAQANVDKARGDAALSVVELDRNSVIRINALAQENCVEYDRLIQNGETEKHGQIAELQNGNIGAGVRKIEQKELLAEAVLMAQDRATGDRAVTEHDLRGAHVVAFEDVTELVRGSDKAVAPEGERGFGAQEAAFLRASEAKFIAGLPANERLDILQKATEAGSALADSGLPDQKEALADHGLGQTKGKDDSRGR